MADDPPKKAAESPAEVLATGLVKAGAAAVSDANEASRGLGALSRTLVWAGVALFFIWRGFETLKVIKPDPPSIVGIQGVSVPTEWMRSQAAEIKTHEEALRASREVQAKHDARIAAMEAIIPFVKEGLTRIEGKVDRAPK